MRLDDAPNLFVAQYEFPSRQTFDTYLATHAPRLRQEGRNRFEPEQVAYSRRTGIIVTS